MKTKNLPNIITLLRILLCVLLYWVSPLSPLFTALYAACGITDVLDGFLARKFKAESRFGAVLDSISDFIFVFIVLVKLIPLIKLPQSVLIWIAGIALVRLASLAAGYYKYRAFAFLHTYANKAVGILLFCFPLAYGFFDMKDLLAGIVCVSASIASLEELSINALSSELNLNIKSILTMRMNS